MAKKKVAKKKRRAPVSKKFIPQASIVSDELYIPNHSGMLDAGKVHRTPTDNLDPVNKKYVDDEIAAIPPVDITGKLDKDGGNADVTIDIGSEDLTTTGDIQATTANLAGMDISNDGTKTTFLGKTGDYNRIGDDANPHFCTDEDDLFVTGKIEGQDAIHGNNHLRLDNSNRNRIYWAKTGVGDQFSWESRWDKDEFLFWITSAVGRQAVFASWWAGDYLHPLQDNPTIFIHSDSNVAVDPDEWMSLTHDEDDGIIKSGKGDIQVGEKTKTTRIGGIAIKLTNTTGAVTIAGQIVSPDTTTDDAVILNVAGGVNPIGVFLDAGVADDAEAWVVISGIADVALDDNVAAVHGNWMGAGVLAGYAATGASPPAAPTHFEEIGHCIESVAAGGGGTHILARCVLHFN